jgi:methionyl-tRNA formyltransferase
MLETLRGLEAGVLKPQPQDHSQASYAPKIEKEWGRIDWSRSARELFNLIRALNPAPGAYTFYGGKRLKIHRSRVAEAPVAAEAGEAVGRVIGMGQSGLIVQTGQGALELVEVQPEGKRVITGMDFVRGHHIRVGERMG